MHKTDRPNNGKLSGKEVASEIYAGLKRKLEARGDLRAPGLAVILVGEDPASMTYTASKAKHAEELGIKSEILRLAEDISEEELLGKIDALNRDETFDGILVQLPLPDHIDASKVQRAIKPEKDVDGFHPTNLGLLMQNQPGPRPCTPQGIMRLLEYYEIPLSGADAVVLGRSNIVGKPMAQLLLQADATVSQLHSKSRDRAKYLAAADIVVVAIGKAEEVKIDELRPGSVVIDVGIHRLPSKKLVGDVERGAEEKVLVTPVPGGVGPLTVAQLMDNCVSAWEVNTGRLGAEDACR